MDSSELEWRRSYQAGIHARLSDAAVIPFREVVFKDGSSPAGNACHQNVDRWVLETDEHRALRGRLIEAEMGPFIRFAAHSVVRSASDEAFDITPLPSAHRFVPHAGAEDEFQKALGPSPLFVWPEML